MFKRECLDYEELDKRTPKQQDGYNLTQQEELTKTYGLYAAPLKTDREYLSRFDQKVGVINHLARGHWVVLHRLEIDLTVYLRIELQNDLNRQKYEAHEGVVGCLRVVRVSSWQMAWGFKMEYTYRINAFSQSMTLRLSDGMLKQFESDGKEIRCLRVEDIRCIRQFAGAFVSSDPNTGRFDSEYCVLETAGGKPISFRNGFYLGQGDGSKWSEKVTNQTEQYAAFLSELKQAIATVNPKVRVIYGGWVAAVAWLCNAVLGLGMTVMGIAIFLTDKISIALAPGLFCTVLGGLLFWSGIHATKRFWPKRVTLEQDARSSKR